MPSLDNSIKLDVGGTIFKTSKSTLTRFDGFFKTMLETNVPIARNQENCIFIDRSPKHFDLTLNFMRDGDVDLPDSDEKVKEISREANYYLLEGLIELCKRKLEPKMKSGVSENYKILETYGQILQVTINSEKPVLMIFYHVNNYGTVDYPNNVNLPELVKKYQTQMKIYFKKGDYYDQRSYNSVWQFTIYHQGNILLSASSENFHDLERLDSNIQKVLNEIPN